MTKSSYDKMWERITKAINENLLSDAEKKNAEHKIDGMFDNCLTTNKYIQINIEPYNIKTVQTDDFSPIVRFFNE